MDLLLELVLELLLELLLVRLLLLLLYLFCNHRGLFAPPYTYVMKAVQQQLQQQLWSSSSNRSMENIFYESAPVDIHRQWCADGKQSSRIWQLLWRC